MGVLIRALVLLISMWTCIKDNYVAINSNKDGDSCIAGNPLYMGMLICKEQT